ncbi:MAG: M20 family metallo-hydrolase [Planctomycetes bacterium]|nr:M20 family metallo-hydrolase [Planctomycetota bacterium]
MAELKIDIDRLVAELQELSRLSATEPPAITRVLYTEPDLAGRAFVKAKCTSAGLVIREDAIGNLFARWPGSEPNLPAIGTGSHIDAIPHSGMYDGTVGVLGGLEAIRALQSSGLRPRRSIELLLFTSEEPTRFGIGCVGSRAMSGTLSPTALAELRDADGKRLDDVRTEAGYRGSLDTVRLKENHYAFFVELHIEQGPILEREGIAIGAVTAIAAPAALKVTLNGSGGHAGAVLMPQRHDALCAAAEIVLAVETAAKTTGSPDTVATVGICQVHPGAINSIPSSVHLTVDVRDIVLESRDRAFASIQETIQKVSTSRGVQAKVETISTDPPATMAGPIVAAIEAASVDGGFSCKRMVSRAYHDSLFMARLGPTGMIFIPCRNGYSHRPDEYASPEAMKIGVETLAQTLGRLAG